MKKLNFGNSLLCYLELALVSFFSPASHATSFMPVPFPSSVEQAPIIVRGKISMAYSDWGNDPDGEKRVFTYTEVELKEVLKGSGLNSPSVMVRELGGEKDGVGYQIAGTATFERGEDVVLFLKSSNREGVYDVKGMMMGKYIVKVEPSGDETLEGAGLLPADGSSFASSNQEKWTLKRLRDLIRTQSNQNPGPDPSSNNANLATGNPNVDEKNTAGSTQGQTPHPDLSLEVNKTATAQSTPGTFATLVGVGLGGAILASGLWMLIRRRRIRKRRGNLD